MMLTMTQPSAESKKKIAGFMALAIVGGFTVGVIDSDQSCRGYQIEIQIDRAPG
jgi:hypothetical protein